MDNHWDVTDPRLREELVECGGIANSLFCGLTQEKRQELESSPAVIERLKSLRELAKSLDKRLQELSFTLKFMEAAAILSNLNSARLSAWKILPSVDRESATTDRLILEIGYSREAAKEVKQLIGSAISIVDSQGVDDKTFLRQGEQERTRMAESAERLTNVFLSWLKEPHCDEVSAEIYLAITGGANRKEVLRITYASCADAAQRAVRRKIGRVGRCLIKAAPVALLGAIPNIVRDLLEKGWPSGLLHVGGIAFAVLWAIHAARSALAEWNKKGSKENSPN